MTHSNVAKSWLTHWMNPGIENLVAEYLECKEQLALLEKQIKTDSQKDIVSYCKENIKELENALELKFFTRRVAAAWRLVHRLQEEMILLIPVEQLTAEGENLIRALKLSAMPDSTKNDWVQLLQEKLKTFDSSSSNVNYTEETRQLLKTASNVLNDFTDDQFWDIGTKRWMSFIYLILLIIALVAFFSTNNLLAPKNINAFNILYIGVIGGLASGILSGEQEYFAKGSFWTPTFYYALARPVFGIIGAFIMFWMLQGQLFVKVEYPLPTSTPINQSVTSKTASQSAEAKAPSKDTLIVFTAPDDESSVYLYILLLLVAGFSGDKILKGVSDKVMSKLFTQAEKNKDASQTSK